MAADESVNIETTSTRLVYENRWMRVREDTIPRQDGSNGIKEDVEALISRGIGEATARLFAQKGQCPGVVDDNANSAELCRRFVYRLPHCGLIRDIARNGEPADFVG
jgi:hypothetical protein